VSGASSPDVIVATDVRKAYGAVRAVDGVSLRVRRGECLGMLGPNGAGKTTTVRIIQGTSPLDSGEVRVFGLDVTTDGPAIRRRSGICHQEDNLDPDFSVERNLLVWARYFSVPRAEARDRAEQLLAFMELTEKRDARIEELSGGLKRRLILARALMNAPELLILDEPTTGLDPQARHQVWDRVRSLARTGTTILLTTHYMEEASRLCDRVVILDRGVVAAEGTPEGLVRREIGRQVVEMQGRVEEALPYAREQGWRAEAASDRLYVYTERGEEAHRELVSRFSPEQCLLRMATLEDVFLKLTGRALRQ